MSVRRSVIHRFQVVALVCAPAVAMAQHGGLRPVEDDEAGAIGVAFNGAMPSGAFQQSTNFSPGGGLAAIIDLGAGSPLAIRLDASGIIYGNGYETLPSSYYPLSLHTTNGMGTLGLGPQLTIGGGPIRLYGFATFGTTWFATWSSYQDNGCRCAPSTAGTNFTDWAASYRAGGGLLVRMGSRRSSTMLDLGASYLHNNPAWYVVPGSAASGPNGTVTLSTVHSATEFVVLHAGVSIILR